MSSDAIREELSGDATDQSKNGQVFNVFHQRIGETLAQDRDVVADSTTLDRRSRDELRSIADTFDAEIHLVLFTNNDQAAIRNAQRDRVVPSDVMTRMLDKYERTLSDLIRESIYYNSITEIGSLS